MMDPKLADWLLPLVPVGDIWGIGRKTKANLAGIGVTTAADLRDMSLRQARAIGTVVLERTVLELQGEPCIAFDDLEPQRKGMAVTRSSGKPMLGFDTLLQAITAHTTRAAEKLRQHGLVAGTMTVCSSTQTGTGKTAHNIRARAPHGWCPCPTTRLSWSPQPGGALKRHGQRSAIIFTGSPRPV